MLAEAESSLLAICLHMRRKEERSRTSPPLLAYMHAHTRGLFNSKQASKFPLFLATQHCAMLSYTTSLRPLYDLKTT